MIFVLYVEDDISLLEIGKALLEKDGTVEVDTCSSVNAALEKISRKRYDVIISDYAMPGTNGIKFLQGLRSAGDTTPFFFFAGKGRKSVIIEAWNQGADYYLEKAGNAKVQFEELRSEIYRAVEKRTTAALPDQPAGVLASVLESVPEGVLITDLQGNVRVYNQNFLSLLNIPEDLLRTGSDSQVLLKYIRDKLEDPEDFSRTIGLVAGEPGITCEGTIRSRGGQVFTWSSRARKTGDTVSGRTWIFSDISDHTRAGHQLATVTEQLRAAEQELHDLRKDLEQKEVVLKKTEEIIDIFTTSASDAILTSSGDRIVHVNERFAEMLGYRAQELAGRSIPDIISPDSSGDVINNIRSGSGGTYEFSALHRNGSSLQIKATGYSISHRGDALLVSVIHSVPGKPAGVHPEKPADISAGSGSIQAEPGKEEAGTGTDLVPEARPGEEIQSGPVFVLSVPAGITVRGHDRVSLMWEVDEAHLSADAGEIQPAGAIDPASLITEIDDIIGPEESMTSRDKGKQYILEWLSDLKRMKRRYF